MQDQKLTYNPDAEVSVLGGLLIDSDKIGKVREILSSEDFYDERYRHVFLAMEWLDDNNIEIDIITLTDALKKTDLFGVIGGSVFLVSLTQEVPTSVRLLRHAKMVADDSAKRKINAAAQAIAATSTSNSTLDETLSQVKQQIAKVNSIGGKQNKYQVSSMLDYIEASKERFQNWGKMQGLFTGFPSLDKLTLGFNEGELIIVAGPTSKGKTLLSMNISNNVAKMGGRVLFVTLEMTKEELTSRYMFVNDGWETEDFSVVASNTIFQENDELSWDDIDGLIQNAKEELDVDLVVIDHLHYFSRDLKNASEELGKITMTFKKNAIRHKIPIILISHIRKLGKDEDLDLNSLRGSSLIAQDSDIVLLVNRDPETNQMGILIDKNRNRGKLSDRTTDWAGRSQRELDTIYLDFNKTKLKDPESFNPQEIFPETRAYKD